MTVFVSDHVSLRERAALRSEPGLEFLEEPEIEVDGRIARTVERAGRPAGHATSGRGGPGEEDRRCLDVRRFRSGQGGGPVRLDAVHVPDDPAIGAGVRVGTRLAFGCERGLPRTDHLAVRPFGEAIECRGITAEHQVGNHEDEAQTAATHGHARGSATAANVPDLTGIEICSGIE